jgi:LysR family transcriptional regulator, cell division regulator
MARTMDSTALATFLTVARQSSVTSAVLELHTVQSNVTARTKQLEGGLRCPALRAHSRAVSRGDKER